jgi:hypothetical protein
LTSFAQCNALKHELLIPKDGSGNKFQINLELNIIIPTFATQIKKNMNVIAQEILSEKMRMNPDPLYIRILHRLQDKEFITEEEFVKTGRVLSTNDFYQRIPTSKLHPECTNVIMYVGDYYIQVLKDGNFFLEMGDDDNPYDMGDMGYTKAQSKDIEIIEGILWTKYANYKFN